MLAVILKKNVFAEGSEVVTLYSREEGKVRAVARSIKSAKSKLSFGLQDLFLSDVEVAASRRSGSLAVITGVKPVNTFMRLRESDQAVHLALFATELLLKSTPDHEPQPALYDLFVAYLEHLDSAGAAEHSLCRTCYTLKFLELIGYGLNLEKLGEDAAGIFAARHVSEGALRALAAAGNFAEQDAAAAHLPAGDVQSACGAVEVFAVHVIERELKTAKFL